VTCCTVIYGNHQCQSHAAHCRYNVLYAEDAGIRLELLPMLAGFFTYKAGVIGRGSLSLFRDLSGKSDKFGSANTPEQQDVDASPSTTSVQEIDELIGKQVRNM
jgi:hypothetical protein